MNIEEIFNKIREERARQDTKWGVQNHSPFLWMPILMEEVGEVANALLDSTKSYEQLLNEIIQVAAVCIAFIECLERNKRLHENT